MPVTLRCRIFGKDFTLEKHSWAQLEGRILPCPVCRTRHEVERAPRDKVRRTKAASITADIPGPAAKTTPPPRVDVTLETGVRERVLKKSRDPLLAGVGCVILMMVLGAGLWLLLVKACGAE